MMIKGQDASPHRCSATRFTEDGYPGGDRFDYLLANPPFGVEWKKVEDPIKAEHETEGLRRPVRGRAARGSTTARFLFLQHMISKMKPPEQGGSRLAIVFNGSPLFTGAAGSGESRDPPVDHRERLARSRRRPARPAVLQHRHLHLLLDRHQPQEPPSGDGKVQLVDARELVHQDAQEPRARSARRSADEQIAEITRLYGDFIREATRVKVFPNEAFGFQRITVERPLRLALGGHRRHPRRAAGRRSVWAKLTDDDRDRHALRDHLADVERTGADRPSRDRHPAIKAQPTCTPTAGRRPSSTPSPSATPTPIRSPTRRATPNPTPTCATTRTSPSRTMPVALRDRHHRTARHRSSTAAPSTTTSTAEVHPYVPDAWVDHTKTKIGYEIPLTRHFYKYVPPRPLAEIDAEIKQLEAEIQDLLREVTE